MGDLINHNNHNNNNNFKNNVIKANFRAKCFEAYGLNNFRNFLFAPECECGCGAKAQLILENPEDIFGFSYATLSEYDCECCAIFAYDFDGNMYAIVKDETDIEEVYDYDQEYDPDECPIKFLGIDETDMEFFKEIDATFRLCCYGLIIQNANGNWDIIED